MIFQWRNLFNILFISNFRLVCLFCESVEEGQNIRDFFYQRSKDQFDLHQNLNKYYSLCTINTVKHKTDTLYTTAHLVILYFEVSRGCISPLASKATIF